MKKRVLGQGWEQEDGMEEIGTWGGIPGCGVWAGMVGRRSTKGRRCLNVAEVGCSLWTHQMHCYRSVPHLCSVPDHAELLWRNSQNVYFAFGRQWKFIPELYLITAGTFVGSRVSSTVLVFPLSGSSCTRGIWFCSSTISPPISFEFIAPSNELFCEHFIHVFFLICISQNISHWKLLYCTLNKNSPFHRCSLRSQGLYMGSLSLSMRFWLQGTSRRQDRFASTHPLAPSSEKTPAAPVSVGTRVQPPRLPRASGRTTPASPNPQVGCTGEGEGGSKGEQRGTGSVASGSRSWRGVGTGQGVVCWLHGFHGFLAEWGASGSISYCSGGQSAPPPRMVNLQCGCRVNLVFTQTCFQLSMFSCLLAHFCDYQHHPLPVRHRCQH